MTSILASRWRAVLVRASRALGGREVAVWKVQKGGELRPVATSTARRPPPGAARALRATLRAWQVEPFRGQCWVASNGSRGGWRVAPVRPQVPALPPAAEERRGRERLTLELAGACIGFIEERARVLHPTASEELARIVQQVPGVLWTTDRELRIISRTGTGGSSHAVLPERMPGVSLLELFERGVVPTESVEAHQRALQGEPVSYLIRTGAHYYDAHVEPLRGADGAVVGVIGIARDVTDRERALEAARRAEEELQHFFQYAPVAIHWLAPDGTILRANDAELDLLGYPRDAFVGRNIREFHEDPAVIADVLRRVAAGEDVENVEARLRHRDGSSRWVLIAANGRFDAGRLAQVRVVMRDITERKAVEQRLEHAALHDPLTDLPNRALFTECLALAIERARRDPDHHFAVLFLDFDHFKVVNDSLGHAMGDRLLVEIAARLRRSMRPGDVVARLGGDEFTVLLDDVTGGAAAVRTAQRLEERLAAPYRIDAQTLRATASIGVVVNDRDYERPEDLLRDADIAMYRAKAQGPARSAVFDVTMRESAQARFDLEADLHRALERREFRLVFQPIVALATGRVHSFEALLRWCHPERGVIQPLQFIPLAEQLGLIAGIGRWVLQDACQQARRWQEVAQGVPVRIAVNVSGKQLDDARLVTEVRETLQDTGLDPRCLGLEITESVLIAGLEPSKGILDELRRLHVQVHMDDFGTGYSSLSYLPRLPLDWIKVDRSFVHRMGARRTDLEIVRSIVDLSKNLGLGVIAEGVETDAQRDRLLAFGCELGQGFRFAEPLEPDAVTDLLRDPKCQPAL